MRVSTNVGYLITHYLHVVGEYIWRLSTYGGYLWGLPLGATSGGYLTYQVWSDGGYLRKIRFGASALVTQPMLQLRPNPTELRSMDYYHQVFCRFRKYNWKVPPPSLLSKDFEKSCFFSKFLVMIFFSLIIFFRPYKDFLSKILCIGMWKQKSEWFENIFINKIFKSWFDHVRVWVKNLLLLLLTFLNPRWYFWNKND